MGKPDKIACSQRVRQSQVLHIKAVSNCVMPCQKTCYNRFCMTNDDPRFLAADKYIVKTVDFERMIARSNSQIANGIANSSRIRILVPNVIKLTNVDRQKTEIKDSEADNHESRYLFCLFLSTPKRQIVICQKLTYSKE